MKTVQFLQDIPGQWIHHSDEVAEINRNLSFVAGKEFEFESFFMVEPDDVGDSGCYQIYGCESFIPYNDSYIEGPFSYPI